MSSALLQLESEIKDRLELFPFFSPFTILVEPRKNIVAEINASIGKIKTLIAPKVIGADDNHPNVHGVYFDEIRIAVGVFQNPVLRGDHAEPFEICEQIHKALKNWTPESLSNVVNPAKPGIEQIADARLNIFTCNFETKGGFISSVTRAATPAIVFDDTDNGWLLSSGTAGAAIFYTIDGTNPSPLNGTLAIGAQTFASGAHVKARAFLAGYRVSEQLTHTIP